MTGRAQNKIHSPCSTYFCRRKAGKVSGSFKQLPLNLQG